MVNILVRPTNETITLEIFNLNGELLVSAEQTIPINELLKDHGIIKILEKIYVFRNIKTDLNLYELTVNNSYLVIRNNLSEKKTFTYFSVSRTSNNTFTVCVRCRKLIK